MQKGLRFKDYKLGCLHGKLHAEDEKSEAHIQRTVFLSQRIRVWRKRDLAPIIRIFAYEIPLENYRRGRCIDLMGYDEKHNLYIIELKKKESNEKVDKVIRQINNYADSVCEILPHIEKEFEAAFFFPIKFSSIKKMIIAPREFYEGQNHLLTDNTIDYGHFKDKDINKRKPKNVINIHLQKAK
jgi:hypothetical protein